MPEDESASRGTTEVAGGLAAGSPGAAANESTVGLEDSAQTLSPPAIETRAPSLKVGESLAGRFSVLRFIARGGMGAVYEATDLLLRTRIALKVIPTSVATDSETLERFRREVLLARRVSHPNVCRVYELYEASTASGGPVQFLTMELLEGESLATVLARRGSMTTEEALPLIRQMCEGLAAAHAEGVIHRDFKSSNVMLVPHAGTSDEGAQSVRVVITDFGVARAIGAAVDSAGEGGRLTGRGGILGTPEYMAPEQVTGGEVTAAADIYALGVVMYEMVTGNLPFPGDSPLASAARRLEEAPPRPELAVPGLDRRWAAAITRCLTRQPDRRFRSALEVVRHLEQPAGRRRSLLPLGAGLLLLLCTVGAIQYAIRARQADKGSVAPLPRPAFAALAFRSELPSPESSWIPTAVAELLTQEMAAAETALRVIPTDRVAQVGRSLGLPADQLAAEASRARVQGLLGASFLASGELTAVGATSDVVRLRVHLVDARAGRELLQLDEDLGRGGARLPDEIPVLASRLRKELGATLSAEQARALSASRVRTVEAARAFAEGVISLRRFDYEDARSHFDSALAVDSNFLEAQRRNLQTWEAQENHQKARRVAEHIRSRSSELTPWQRAEIDARVLALDPEQRKGVEAQMALFDALPDDIERGLTLATIQSNMPAARAKVALVRRLRQLRGAFPDDLRLDAVEARAEADAGEAKEAHGLLAKGATRAKELGAKVELGQMLHVEGEVLWIREGRGIEALERFAEAERLLEEAGELDDLAFTKQRKATLLTNLGPVSKALAALEDAAGIDRKLGNRLALQAVLLLTTHELLLQGELELAQRKAEEARAEFNALDAPPSLSYFLRMTSIAFAAADLRGVLDANREVRSLDEPFAAQIDAWVLREQGYFRESRESLQRAAKLQEQQGSTIAAASRAREACALDCDEGRAGEGLACLAKHRPSQGMGEFLRSVYSLQQAACSLQAGELSEAEAAARDVTKVENFNNRIRANIILMRVAAARGQTAAALAGLRRLLLETTSKRMKLLEIEAALALGEVELKAGRPEGRSRLLKLEKEANSRELFRISRLAKEALQRHLSRAAATKPG